MTTRDFQTRKPISILFSYFKPHRGLFILDLVCATIVALIDLAFPLVTRKSMYDLLPNQQYQTFFLVMAVMMTAFLVRALLYYVIAYWGHTFGILVEADIRRDLFTHVQELDVSFFDHNRTGQLMSRLTSDLFEITELAHHGPEDLLISTLTILGAIGIMASIEWRLTLVVACILPVFLFAIMSRRRKMSAASRNEKQKTAAINVGIESSLSGIRTARAFANEAAEIDKFNTANENFKVSIRGGISSFSITAMSAEDYPELPDVESEKGVVLPQKQLKEMISGTIFAVSENQARPIHTGVLFEVDNDSITSVAVDGYRLALRRYLPEESLERTLKFVAPAAALKEVEKILGDTDDPATFYPGSKHILFTIGDATLVCRILEGEFLDWRRVLPQNNPVKLVGNVSRLTDSIERVGLVISEKLKSPVRCKFGDNAAELRTVSTIGEAYDVCPIAGDGKDLEIGFNCKYLLDALRAVPDSECTLEMINGLSPIVLNPTEGNRYSYMVLPVRLKAGE